MREMERRKEDAETHSAASAADQAATRLGELESLYRNAPVGLSFIDCDLRYVRVNKVIADANGLTPEEMVGKTYREISPDTAALAEPFLLGLMERGEPVRDLEVRSRPPTDPQTDHIYLLSMEPVRNPGGEVVGWVSAVHDVTDLRRAEAAAARRLEELEALYARTPVGLCHLDASLRIVRVNPLFARIADPPCADPVGTLAEETLRGPIGAQILPELRFVARSGRPSTGIEVSGRLPSAPKREYTWLLDTHPVASAGAEPSGVISVLQDVSALADRRREVETVRDRLAEAQRVARVGSWEWDLIEDRVWWSRELYDLFGEGPLFEPSYAEFFERVHPQDRERLRRQMESVVADAGPEWVTFRILRRDGTMPVVFSAVRLERTGDGLAARVIGICQDLTGFGSRDPGEPRDA